MSENDPNTPPQPSPPHQAQDPAPPPPAQEACPGPGAQSSGQQTNQKSKTVEGSLKGVSFHLVEEAPDRRLDRSIFQFTVANHSDSAISITKLIPIEYDEMEVVVDPNTPLRDLIKVSIGLREQLSGLLYGIIQSDTQNPTPIMRSHLQRFLMSVLGETPGRASLRRLLVSCLSRRILRRVDRYLKRRGVIPLLRNHDEAQSICDALKGTALYGEKSGGIDALMGNLKAVEKQIQSENKPIVIEPGSVYNAAYVVSFERAFFNELQHTFTLECHYGKDSTRSYITNVSVSSPTSPYPLPLTLISMAFSATSAMFASTLNDNLTQTAALLNTANHYVELLLQWSRVAQTVQSPEIIANTIEAARLFSAHIQWQSGTIASALRASLVACVLFNIYERTPLWEKLSMGLNWRSAMVVGFISGLLSDKILNWFIKIMSF